MDAKEQVGKRDAMEAVASEGGPEAAGLLAAVFEHNQREEPRSGRATVAHCAVAEPRAALNPDTEDER